MPKKIYYDTGRLKYEKVPVYKDGSDKAVNNETIINSNISQYFDIEESTYPFEYSPLSETWESTNQGIDNSSSELILISRGDYSCTLQYKVYSESNDVYNIRVNNSLKATCSGGSYANFMNLSFTVLKGQIIKFAYSKNATTSSNNDTAYFKNFIINGTYTEKIIDHYDNSLVQKPIYKEIEVNENPNTAYIQGGGTYSNNSCSYNSSSKYWEIKSTSTPFYQSGANFSINADLLKIKIFYDIQLAHPESYLKIYFYKSIVNNSEINITEIKTISQSSSGELEALILKGYRLKFQYINGDSSNSQDFIKFKIFYEDKNQIESYINEKELYQIKKIYYGKENKSKKIKYVYFGVNNKSFKIFDDTISEISYSGFIETSYKGTLMSAAKINNKALLMNIQDKTKILIIDENLTFSTIDFPVYIYKQPSLTATNEYVFIAGGQLNTGRYHNKVYAYNSSLTVSEATSLDRILSHMAAVNLNNNAIFACGEYSTYYNNASSYSTGARGEIYLYNNNLTKTVGNNTLIPRYHLLSNSFDNYALFAGGGTGGSSSYWKKNVEAVTPSLTIINNLTSLSDVVYNSSNISTAKMNGYILFQSGSSNYAVPKEGTTVDAYTSSLTKIPVEGLSRGRSGACGGSSNDYVLFVGGRASARGYSSGTSEVEMYNIELIKSNLNPLLYPRSEICSVNLKKYILFFGGREYISNSENKESNILDIFYIN